MNCFDCANEEYIQSLDDQFPGHFDFEVLRILDDKSVFITIRAISTYSRLPIDSAVRHYSYLSSYTMDFLDKSQAKKYVH